jgi:hypothetical protein
MKQCRSIIIVNNQGSCSYYVGTDGVTEIRDETIEYPDGIEWLFAVYKGEMLFRRIINCPVDAEYLEE